MVVISRFIGDPQENKRCCGNAHGKPENVERAIAPGPPEIAQGSFNVVLHHYFSDRWSVNNVPPLFIIRCKRFYSFILVLYLTSFSPTTHRRPPTISHSSRKFAAMFARAALNVWIPTVNAATASTAHAADTNNQPVNVIR